MPSRDFGIHVDPATLDEITKALRDVKDGVRRVIQISVNKTLPGVGIEVKKVVTKSLNVSAAAVKKQTKTNKVYINNLTGSVVIGGSGVLGRGLGLPMIGFMSAAQRKAPAPGKRKNVRVRIIKDRPIRTVKSAFIATMKSGHVAVFKRSGKTTKTGKPGIKEVYTTSIPDILRDENRSPTGIDVVIEEGNKRLDKELLRQTDYLLRRTFG